MTEKKKSPRLFNSIDKKVLKERIQNDRRPRTTLSFYNYHPIDPETIFQLRDDFYQELESLEVLGRIYLSPEGINAQISVLDQQMSVFQKTVAEYDFLQNVFLNQAVEENSQKFSFYKLIVRVRDKIVADGLPGHLDFSPERRGTPLTPQQFHEFLEEGGVAVDVRNHYESEVGHFRNALTVDADTFRIQLPMLADKLQSYRDQKLLLYCTGGIRCEKAGTYLKQNGYPNVFQLKGGIIAYAKYVKEKGLPGHFLGKNFVFDGRMGERVTDDVIAHCHQCGNPCDEHTNCRNDACHLLFIQCSECKEKFEGCCGEECRQVIWLPIEKQREIRRGNQIDSPSVYKSRIRPRINSKFSTVKKD